MRIQLKISALLATSTLALGVGLIAVQSAAQSAVSQTVKVSTRRITESQYRHTIRDLFGADIVANARFEPDRRDDGLLAVGSSGLSITASGFEQYYALAKSISEQVADPKRRDALVGCKPANPAAADAACAQAFLARVGEVLYRRPLSEAEIDARVKTADLGATQAKDFYAGLKLSLTSLMMAPEFLFRVETAEPDPAHPGAYRLDGYAKASRLSYLFWDAPPDADLLAAAQSGAIHTPDGLKQQITRLASSPRLQDGARAFFTDMLQLDAFEGFTKDPATYPKFNQSVADAAREQLLKTVVDLLVVKKRDYRDLFTSNETFINRALAAVYNVPYASAQAWAPYTFPASSERAGIQSQVGFLAVFAHPGSSSPTKRGIKINEIFRCSPTPDPPPNVDFSKVQALQNGTVRTRLLAHMENEGCASCHRASDPPGLALEHFDGLGQLRTTENGQTIDVSAEVGQAKFSGAAGLGAYLHTDSRVPSCLVRNVFTYGVGRHARGGDRNYLAQQTAAFAASGYRYPELLASIAGSPEFFQISPPEGAQPAPAKIALAHPDITNGVAR
ncbi:DUF1592 domain-containing protein [Phenylobacterium sp.]|uniref:DUF1592 domain-containing protein n=1 Tax=Phenylobacterium sp. TaxID=1871053 RepID=UPI002F4275BF